MDVEVKIIDLERVMEAVKNLSEIDKNKTIKTGLRDASNIFVRAGKMNLKNRMKNKKGDSGTLLKSFKSKVKRNKLGSLAGFGTGGGAAHLIDRGTANRVTSKGYNRGAIKPNYFWDDAIEQNKGAAIDTVLSSIEKAVMNIANK